MQGKREKVTKVYRSKGGYINGLMETVIDSSCLTPIEIALGVDTDGMTTAKELYEFLELDKSQYARWYRNNITGNEFAEEGIDFWVLDSSVENPQGGRPTQDFKLTARFAKKLSMTQKNKRGEQAREYFTRVEDKAKEMVLHMKEMSPELQAIFTHDRQIQAVEKRVDFLEDTMTIDYGQAKALQNMAKSQTMEIVGGEESRAYTYQYPQKGANDKPQYLYKKLIARLWSDYKDYFEINSYKNTPRVRFEEAKDYIKGWQAPTNMRLDIERINADGFDGYLK